MFPLLKFKDDDFWTPEIHFPGFRCSSSKVTIFELWKLIFNVTEAQARKLRISNSGDSFSTFPKLRFKNDDFRALEAYFPHSDSQGSTFEFQKLIFYVSKAQAQKWWLYRAPDGNSEHLSFRLVRTSEFILPNSEAPVRINKFASLKIYFHISQALARKRSCPSLGINFSLFPNQILNFLWNIISCYSLNSTFK